MPTTETTDLDSNPGAATCAVCGNTLDRAVKLRLREYRFHACKYCKSWTCLPRPTASQQAAIHDSEDYFGHPYFKLRRDINRAQRERCRAIFSRLSRIVDIESLRGQQLLDIGCDTGIFLKIAQEEFGIVPVGVDVAARAVAEAKRRGIEAYWGRIENAPAQLSEFHAITAIDLIEHVADPTAFLLEVHRRLRPGGVAYLETPNINSAVYRVGLSIGKLTGGRTGHLMERLFPPQHIQYFTPESLGDRARHAGFEAVSLFSRPLPIAHISASLGALAPIEFLQGFDRILGTGILICSVLRRPLQG
jgi:2-polyprenyl-3-methyl-5-hydroxy-6-metoxy-1,4-benzoquinol methylase